MNTQVFVGFFIVSLFSLCNGCTNLLVTPGAAKAGNSMIYYSFDEIDHFGKIQSLPATDYPAGTMMQVYDIDSGTHTGEIPQVAHTYNVIANINEHGLSIGETTFGGVDVLISKHNGIIDYGTLISLALQRAQTAREAIQVMANLTNEYGYYSMGESFSIADKNEVWVLELIGKGDFEKGTVWVARRVQDGYITSHANQARITQISQNDTENFLFAPDVISFAQKHGLYNGTDKDFSFSDIYDPVTFIGARLMEVRVWSIFNQFIDMAPWLDYAQGYNLTNRMPWEIQIKNEHKLSLNDTFWVTRNHNEDTWFDNTQEVGAGPFNSPYRWRPLVWKYEGRQYVNERTVAIQQTSWNFASELRRNVPKEISGVTWFAMDDSCCGVKVPIYGTNTKAPVSWAKATDDKTNYGDLLNFDYDHAFWAVNMVANYAYSRWSEIYPEISALLVEQEKIGFELNEYLDTVAEKYINNNESEKAFKFIEEQTNQHANNITQVYRRFYGQLFVKYRDGGVTTKATIQENPQCGCNVKSEGYEADGNAWYGRIVNETGSHYEVPEKLVETGRVNKHINY